MKTVARGRTSRVPITRSLTRVTAILVALVVVPGCGLGGIGGTIQSATDKAVAALDQAIGSLANASADWQKILQDTLDKLSQDARDLIGNDLSRLIQRGIATAGVEFRCNVDFVPTRIRQGLIRIRARLLNQPVEDPEPTFCEAIPEIVDRALVPASLKAVTFTGYDFDSVPVQVFLQDGGSLTDVSAFLDRPTHYLMTLKFGANGVQLSPQSQRFIVRWKGRDIATLGITQPQPRVCRTRVASRSIVPIDFIPRRVKGDADFSGNGPGVWISVTLTNTVTQVVADISMSARETEDDWTTASGSMTKPIFTVDPGEKIAQIIGGAGDSFPYTDTNHDPDTFFRGAGPVHHYTFIGDTRGDEAGTRTKVTVFFNDLRVLLEETGDCISPRALLQAKADRLVSQALLTRLQPALLPVLPMVQPHVRRPMRTMPRPNP